MRPARRGATPVEAHERVVVWVDSREARIARRRGDAVALEQLTSDVPPHSVGPRHVRHDPALRHGGAGDAQSAAERRRIEHLDAFLGHVEARLDPDADLDLIGPGTVHERLARRLQAADVRHHRGRAIVVERTGRLTDRQLAARLRVLAEA